MEHIVLGMLILQSMTIYDLNKSFNMGLSMIYAASYGNLQYAVKKLLTKKMISFEQRVENGRNKKIYHIQEKGIKEFFRWMMEDIDPKNIETLMLAKIYFLGLVEDDDKYKIIDNILIAVEEYASGLFEIKKFTDDLDLTPKEMEVVKYQMKTLDYGIGTYEFAVSWLKKIRNEL